LNCYELDEFDQGVLCDRAISFDANDYYSEPSAARLRDLGFKSRGLAPALVIPICHTEGSKSYQIRPHEPLESKPKYLVPSGHKNRLHISPKTRRHVNDPGIPLLITESFLKADSAASGPGWAERCCAIGMAGVWGWRGQNDKGGLVPLEDFDDIVWAGKRDGTKFSRDAYLIPDSDYATKPQVQAAINGLAKFLRSKKHANVMIVQLRVPKMSGATGKVDDKIGLDDFRAMNPSATFGALKAFVIDSIAEGDGSPAEFLRLNEEFAVIHKPPAILHRPTGQLYRVDVFNKLIVADRRVPSGDGTAPAGPKWLGWKGHSRYTGLAYEPGQPRELSGGVYNLSAPLPDIPMDDASIERYYEGIRTLINPFLGSLFGSSNASDAVMLMQWAAYPIQHPGTKMVTTILLRGEQGRGKSLIGQMIAAAYPPDQALECSMDVVTGKHNKIVEGVRFVQCDEMLINGSNKRIIADKIKHIITRDKVIVEPKGIDSYQVRDCANYLFTTNHSDAAHLESGDRRVIVLEIGDGEPLDQALADKIGKWRKTEEGRNTIRFFLERYPIDTTIFVGEKDQHTHQVDFDLKHYFEAIGEDPGPFSSPNLEQETATSLYLRRHTFSPTAKAPMTAAKAEMIEDSRSALDQKAFDLIQDAKIDEDGNLRTQPSHHDLISLHGAAERAEVDLKRFSEKAWTMALKKHGAEHLKRVRFGKPVHIWVLNHASEWLGNETSKIVKTIRDARMAPLSESERYADISTPKNSPLSDSERGADTQKKAKY
jgi:hypothetical protein